MCFNYLSNNVWQNFSLPVSVSVMVTWNTWSKLSFCSKFEIETRPCYHFKCWHGGFKSLDTLFWYGFGIQIDETWKVVWSEMYKILSFWAKIWVLKKWERVDAILQDVSVAETIMFNGKILSFTVPKMIVTPVTRLNVPPKHGRSDQYETLSQVTITHFFFLKLN